MSRIANSDSNSCDRPLSTTNLWPRTALFSARQRERYGYVMTQPPTSVLKALLQSDWTANAPVLKLTVCAAPWLPVAIQAHLSPFSAPPESSHPVLGNWSLTVSAASCPPTMVMPAVGPSPLKLAPQLAPASVECCRYSRQ
jgi:hypothetical protein